MSEYEQVGYKMVGRFAVSSWRPRLPVGPWLVGETASGRRVEIIGDPYADERAAVTIDGCAAKILEAERRRDGGTTLLRTDRGRVYVPQRAFPTPRPVPATLDDEVIL